MVLEESGGMKLSVVVDGCAWLVKKMCALTCLWSLTGVRGWSKKCVR